MPVIITQHIPPTGVGRLRPGEFLGFALTPEPTPGRNAIFDFVCVHRELLQISNDTAQVFRWYLGSQPPPGLPDANVHFPTDVPTGEIDVYVVGLNFFQCPGYRLEIVHFPSNGRLKDTTYIAQSTNDRWRETFVVAALA